MAIIELKKFSEYSNNIQDDVNDVNAVLFVGIVVNKDLYVHFDVLIDSSIYRVVFTILPEGDDDYSAFEDIYMDLEPHSIIDIAGELGQSYRVMVAISSFKKLYDDNNLYSLFCAVNEDEVFEIIFNKAQFLYISDILSNILNFNMINKKSSLRLLRFSTVDIDTIKLQTPLEYDTTVTNEVYYFVSRDSLAPRKFLDPNQLINGVVFLPIRNEALGGLKWLLIPISLPRKEYKKVIKNCTNLILDDLRNLDSQLDNLIRKAGGKENVLLLEEFIHAPFSRKSDHPMDRTTLVVYDRDGKRTYLDTNTELFATFRKSTTKKLIDGV